MIVLDAPGVVATARKKDLDVVEADARRRGYLALATSRRSVVIDATQPLDAVVAEVTGVVTAYAEGSRR